MGKRLKSGPDNRARHAVKLGQIGFCKTGSGRQALLENSTLNACKHRVLHEIRVQPPAEICLLLRNAHLLPFTAVYSFHLLLSDFWL